MVEILHWLTLYAPVLFAIQMWFGPGWCCPPPCEPEEPFVTCDALGSCIDGKMGVEYSIEISGVQLAACTGMAVFDGIYIAPSVGGTSSCRAILNDTAPPASPIEDSWRNRSGLSCPPVVDYTLLFTFESGLDHIEARFEMRSTFGTETLNIYPWRVTPSGWPYDCFDVSGLELFPAATTPASPNAAYNIASATCIVDRVTA